MTRLVRIVITKRPDGLWDVVRERAANRENCSGCRSLEEALDYVRAHDWSDPQKELILRENQNEESETNKKIADDNLGDSSIEANGERES